MRNGEETIRREMLASLCLIGEGQEGRRLFAFLSPSEESDLEKIAGRLCLEGEVDRRALLTRLQRWVRVKRFSALEEIHPGWIVEKLAGESPRLLGLLCRFLSGDKVQYLIRHLPSVAKARLPQVRESYRVAPEIGELVRRLVEERLHFPLPPPSEESFSFFHIPLLKADDLRVLFWDLGLDEVRQAFFEVEPKILRAFLSRFSAKEAGEIRRRIEGGTAVSAEEKKGAQRHLVSLPLEQIPAESLFREIGHSVFGKALSRHELPLVDPISLKISPEEGYRLRRVLEESAGSIPPEVVTKERERIVGRVFSLARQGLIRRYWKEGSERK